MPKVQTTLTQQDASDMARDVEADVDFEDLEGVEVEDAAQRVSLEQLQQEVDSLKQRAQQQAEDLEGPLERFGLMAQDADVTNFQQLTNVFEKLGYSAKQVVVEHDQQMDNALLDEALARSEELERENVQLKAQIERLQLASVPTTQPALDEAEFEHAVNQRVEALQGELYDSFDESVRDEIRRIDLRSNNDFKKHFEESVLAAVNKRESERYDEVEAALQKKTQRVTQELDERRQRAQAECDERRRRLEDELEKEKADAKAQQEKEKADADARLREERADADARLKEERLAAEAQLVMERKGMATELEQKWHFDKARFESEAAEEMSRLQNTHSAELQRIANANAGTISSSVFQSEQTALAKRLEMEWKREIEAVHEAAAKDIEKAANSAYNVYQAKLAAASSRQEHEHKQKVRHLQTVAAQQTRLREVAEEEVRAAQRALEKCVEECEAKIDDVRRKEKKSYDSEYESLRAEAEKIIAEVASAADERANTAITKAKQDARELYEAALTSEVEAFEAACQTRDARQTAQAQEWEDEKSELEDRFWALDKAGRCYFDLCGLMEYKMERKFLRKQYWAKLVEVFRERRLKAERLEVQKEKRLAKQLVKKQSALLLGHEQVTAQLNAELLRMREEENLE